MALLTRNSSQKFFKILNPVIRTISVSCNQKKEYENAFLRAMRILKGDMQYVKGFIFPKKGEDGKYRPPQRNFFPHYCDVVVIGGGSIGSSIAYWLKEKSGKGEKGLRVVVVEQDPTYKHASTVLSVGGLRQQFSIPENIVMSLFGAEFLRNINQHLGDDINVSFVPHGYLTLATEAGAEQLKKNAELQRELGAKNEVLTAKQLKETFPWMDVTGIELGCHGLENEGWFDPWALLYGFKKRSVEMGVEYITARAIDFEFKHMPLMVSEQVKPNSYEGLDKVLVQMPDGEIKDITFGLCVIAAGPQSAKVAELARVGVGEDLLSIPLPIEPRKRFVYCFECRDNPPGIDTPLLIDPSHTYFRREGLGGLFIGGRSPEPNEEPPCDNLDLCDTDYEYFNTHVWPVLAKRVPAFEKIKLRSAWAGYYEYNKFDENGIVGPHPYYTNLYIASGFSGHGIQHAPAVGRAVAEMIIDGGFRTIDLTRFGFDRLLLDKPMFESQII